MRQGTMWFVIMTASALLAGAATANAQSVPASYQGTVSWIEIWKNGNVAFTLNASGLPCNGQFILNKSDPGLKNQYAALVTAKSTGGTVRVWAAQCLPAEEYGASYAEVTYLYL